ncbi:MAG: NADH dehydrogenase FAD-containing subunit [Actinomycetota bacterium]|nr:MAG: NADH dehydrogenase FAD-containing subunit [Actinomycetota bacterium]
MDLLEVMATAGAIRDYLDVPNADRVLYDILNVARFAPSGGNRQPWRVVIVKDRHLKASIRELYSEGWKEYMAHVKKGLVPFAPISNGRWDGPAIDLDEAATMTFHNQYADQLDQAPILLLLLVRLQDLACLDNGLGRQSIVGGGSIYPFGHNILLASRSYGLGGVMTTVICRRESQVKSLLDVPSEFAVAGLITLGIPKKFFTKLTRMPVEEFTHIDKFNGVPLDPLSG